MESGGTLHTWGLIVLTANAALGGVLFLSLLTRGRRTYIPTALIGGLAAFLVEPQLGRLTGADATPFWPLLATALGAGLAVVVRLIVDAALRDAKGIFEALAKVRDGAPGVLVPERWALARDPSSTTSQDHVRRWFVAISAATGAVVGGIVGLDLFREAFLDAIFYRRLMFTILFTALSMFLLNPIQAYVFGVGSGDRRSVEPGSELASFFDKGIDWRAAWRLAMVVVVAAQLSIISSCLETVTQHAEATVILNIMVMAATPAIAGYYWCAALQLAARPVRQAMLGPSLAAGAVMNYGIALPLIVAFLVGQIETTTDPVTPLVFALVLSPVLAIALAYVMAALTTTLYTWLGAYAIDKAPPRFTMPAVAAAIIVASALNLLIFNLPLLLIANATLPSGEQADIVSTLFDWTFVGQFVGWIVGLWASGFPSIVKASNTGAPLRAPAPGVDG